VLVDAAIELLDAPRVYRSAADRIRSSGSSGGLVLLLLVETALSQQR